jgi:hypothetical protein
MTPWREGSDNAISSAPTAKDARFGDLAGSDRQLEGGATMPRFATRVFSFVLPVVIASVAWTTPARADVTAISGSVLFVSPPPSVAVNVLESNTNIFLFAERTTLTLPTAITPNITAPGTYPPDALTPSTIPAGTVVDTFFLHADRVGTGFTVAIKLSGSVTFDSEILGLQIGGDGLVFQSEFLGAPGTAYTPAGFGYELGVACPNGDIVTLSADRRTVSVCSALFDAADDLRIITRGRILVDVDIKPGGVPNSINLKSNGVVPVAILGSDELDVTQIDAATLLFAGAGPDHSALEDVNDDSVLDLVMHVPTQSTNLQAGDAQACVAGSLLDATPFKGCDSVRIRP